MKLSFQSSVGFQKKLFSVIGFVLLPALLSGLLYSCLDRDTGDTPLGPPVSGASGEADSVRLRFSLYAEPAVVPATNSSQAVVKAVLADANRNPLTGRVVYFTSSLGTVSASDTTDEFGEAQAVFRAEQRNANAVIAGFVSDGRLTVTDTITIAMTGLRVDVQPTSGDALLNTSVPISIRVLDTEDKAVPFAAISLTGAASVAGLADGNGRLATSITSSTQGRVWIVAESNGARDSASVDFWQVLPGGQQAVIEDVGSMRIFAAPSSLLASNTDESIITVRVFDEKNNPVMGRQVRFSATHGIIQAHDTTNSLGEAQVTYRSVPLNTEAKIVASMTVGDSSIAVSTSITLSGVEVLISPFIADAIKGTLVPVTITVLDGAGKPVPGAQLSISGAADANGTTSGSGRFQTTVTRASQGRVSFGASTLGASSGSYVDFWDVLPDTRPQVEEIRKMRIYSSRSQLKADNTDFATITVILTNENNNPAGGDTVRFSSNLGIIDEFVVVDTTGRATATLRSSPVNGTCRVDAQAVGRNLAVFTNIIFSGVTLQLIPDQTNLNVNQTATIGAFLKDGSGNPIGGDEVAFGLSGAGAGFENGLAAYTVALDPNGYAAVRLSTSTEGPVSVWASALNTSDTVIIAYSNKNLSVTAAQSSISVGGVASTTITATYVDGSSAPVPGATISFATNAGSITPASAVTNAQGVATATLTSANFAGTATVQATGPGAVDQVTVAFTALVAAAVKLEISPDNIGINGGIANLTATVTDANGNMVTGQDVNFRILKGPGGGEYIVKPVVTSQSGIAISQIKAGSLPSLYRGTEVVAEVGAIADTSKLTISGPPHIITVSRPEDDTIVVAEAGNRDPSTFRFNVGAVVQDINGNDVADGTEVHFSAVVTGLAVGGRVFSKWKGLSSAEDIEPIYEGFAWDLPFEDINNNYNYDPGIDLVLDWMSLWTPSVSFFNNQISSRGEDVDGDGVMAWDPAIHDRWYDFNRNGVCDPGVGENDTVDVLEGGAIKTVYADLNNNGVRDLSEILVDNGTVGVCDLPANGDYPYASWDIRWKWMDPISFMENDFAVVINAATVTKGGIAETQIAYPRQFARRLRVTVNAEANGIRDKDGERFVLPLVVGQ